MDGEIELAPESNGKVNSLVDTIMRFAGPIVEILLMSTLLMFQVSPQNAAVPAGYC
jgi:hypothetical protein